MTSFLPTTRREMEARGWDEADVILLSGDAYVDHPSFGVAVIGRVLEAEGLRVAVIPQPAWTGDLRDFRRLGRPRLFFGVAPGCMDSMVNKYTAARRLRAEDAYSPDGRHDRRPEYPTIVYTQCVRRVYPDAPVVLGGIEASMRRLAHYDYWQDRLRPSILVDSDADLIIYGMGERPIRELARRLNALIEAYDESLTYDEKGEAVIGRKAIQKVVEDLPQTVRLKSPPSPPRGDVAMGRPISTSPLGGLGGLGLFLLHSFVNITPERHAENFRHIEEESNTLDARTLVQEQREGLWAIVNPPYPPLTTDELDSIYNLPYTRLPHPKYRGHRIPAYEMIRHSVTIHRGCFGGCAFCTISAHQGKHITSRSAASILREVEAVTRMPDFKGYLTDLGGPSANMYGMKGRREEACRACRRPSCIHPKVCPNLVVDHRPLTALYRAADRIAGVKKTCIGSGVRYDLLLHHNADETLNEAAREYTRELTTRHVSGRLKVAPEHTEDHVLRLMRKPPFRLFGQFKSIFEATCAEHGLRQQLIPYFISAHPGCTEQDMAALADKTRRMHYHLEQVQDFTPTPMTLATTMWATGLDPYTLRPVYVARTREEKEAQRKYFFWYKQ